MAALKDASSSSRLMRELLVRRIVRPRASMRARSSFARSNDSATASQASRSVFAFRTLGARVVASDVTPSTGSS